MNEFQMTGDQMQMKSAIVQLMKAGSPDSTVEEELRNFVAVLTTHNLSEEEMKFQVLEILTEGRLQRELLLKSAQSTPVATSKPKALSILTDWRHSLDLHQEALPILCATTPLQEKASDDLMWSDLKELYNEVNADGRSEGRVLASLINSILTQNRYYFCMTREKTRELVTKDANHIGDVAFDNSAWRRILSYLIQKVRLIRVIREGHGHQPSIYTIEDESFRDRISIGNPERQLQQCEDFVTRTGTFKRQTNKE